MQTLQDTAQFAAEQLQPDETTLQSGFVMDISKGSLSMEATGLGACWGETVCECLWAWGCVRAVKRRVYYTSIVHVCVEVDLLFWYSMTQSGLLCCSLQLFSLLHV